MVERLPDMESATRRSLPWGLVGMLGIVLAIESCLARHALDLSPPNHWDWRENGRSAGRSDRVHGRDLLIFGDSALKFGLMPGVIEERTGRRSFNLALSSGQTTSSYFLLRRALRAGATPSAILIDVTPHMFMFSPKINQQLWPDILTGSETCDLSWSVHDLDFFSTLLLAKTLPSIQYRQDIRSLVLAAFRGEESTYVHKNRVYLRNWTVNEGAQLESEKPTPFFDPDQWTHQLYPFWAPDPVNRAYLERFLELAGSRNIPVLWVLPPIHPAVQYRIERSGFDAAFIDFVQQIRSKYPKTTVIDARKAGFVEEEFLDVIHLDRRGALRFSESMADLLARRDRPLIGGSWVKLDAGRAREINLPMEDLTSSAEFLRGEGLKTRR